MPTTPPPDLICLSRLRWSPGFERTHELMARFAAERRVFFVEEPVVDGGGDEPLLAVRVCPRAGVRVVVPHLPASLARRDLTAPMRHLMEALLVEHAIDRYLLWYDTPRALAYTAHLAPLAVAYDRIDPALLDGAPPMVLADEQRLTERADVLFTDEDPLDEREDERGRERERHRAPRPFPSSANLRHFARARTVYEEPPDQADLPLPRLGFFGPLDDRVDLALVGRIAALRPDWSLILIGPVGKVAPPRAPNLHLLGPRPDEALPAYLAAWDVALLPFVVDGRGPRQLARTRALALMAAGCPIVSTPRPEIVRPYGERGLVRVAADADAFVRECEAALDEDAIARTRAHDHFLATRSWDRAYAGMRALVDAAVGAKQVLRFPVGDALRPSP
jgi:UDP-galactopyranose mutase